MRPPHRFAVCLVVFGLLSTLLSAGCPFQATAQDTRLQANERLRAACPWATDAEIEAALLVCDLDRQDGWTREETLRLVLENCISPEHCACVVVCVDQVYVK